MKSYSFSFLLKKLPLDALGASAFTFLNFGPFYQNGRLGPPESESLLRMGRIPEEFPDFRVKKQ